jgi:hypothetical protein
VSRLAGNFWPRTMRVFVGKELVSEIRTQHPNKVFTPEDVYGRREYEKVASYVAEVYQGEPVKAVRIAEALDLAYWKVQVDYETRPGEVC